MSTTILLLMLLIALYGLGSINPVSPPTLPKAILVIPIILISITLSACSAGSNNTQNQPTQDNNAPFMMWSQNYLDLKVGQQATVSISYYGLNNPPDTFALYQTDDTIAKITPESCTLNTSPIPTCYIQIIAAQVGQTRVTWQILPSAPLLINVYYP